MSLRVAVVPSDQGACGHYRLAWPAFALHHAEGYDLDLSLHAPDEVQMRTVARPGRARGFEVRGLPDLDTLDVVILQRIGSENGVRLVRHLQEHGIAVVLDADDALWAVDPESASFRAWNGQPNHWRYMDEAARLADLVTVTTDALARRYGAHGRCEVIPNFVPRASLIDLDALRERARREGYPSRVGWSGVLASHPSDLTVAHGAAHMAVRGARTLHVQGERDLARVARQWRLPETALTGHPGVPLTAYHEALDAFDVGLVPLADTPFNRAKSSLKALEYAARGIPSLVSATPANRALSEWVRGVHVMEDPRSWAFALDRLLRDPAEVAFEAVQARVDVEQHLTIEGNVWRWHDAWRRAHSRRRSLDGVR